MSDCAKQLARLLRENNFVLERSRKHLIYRQKGTNRIFVTSSTPSDGYRGIKNAITQLEHVLAQPPRCEVLTVAEFEKHEREIQLQKQVKQVARAAATPAKSEGTGFIYIDRKRPSQPMTEEQKAKSRQAAEWAKLRNRWAENERKVQNQLVEFILNGLRQDAINFCEKEQADEWTTEQTIRRTLTYIEPTVRRLSRFAIRCQAEDLKRIAIGFADHESLAAKVEELVEMMSLPKEAREDMQNALLQDCERFIDFKKEAIKKVKERFADQDEEAAVAVEA
jgi:hypothetical protein